MDLLGLEKDSNPKESTCKGGIIGTEDEDNRDKTIVFKSDCTGLVTPKDTYANIKDDYKRRTVTAVEDFFKFVLVDMNSAFNFDKISELNHHLFVSHKKWQRKIFSRSLKRNKSAL